MFGHDFPYLDTRDLNLDWLLKNMKKLVQDWTEYQLSMNQQFSDLTHAFDALKEWVDDYFENLDVSAEIEQKLENMAVTGELGFIMQPIVAQSTAEWLAEHITQPSTPAIDNSLSVAGAGADSKTVGKLIGMIAPCVRYDHFETNVAAAFNTGTRDLTITVDGYVNYLINGKNYNIAPGTYTVNVPYAYLSIISWSGSAFIATQFSSYDFTKGNVCMMIYGDNIIYDGISNEIVVDPAITAVANVARGVLFAYMSHGYLTLRAMANCKLIYGNQVIDAPSTFSWQITTAGLYLFGIDKSDSLLKVKYYTEDIAEFYALGYVYNYTVYALHDSELFITNRAPVPALMSRADVPLYLNFDRLGYRIAPGAVIDQAGTRSWFGKTIKYLNYRPTSFHMLDFRGDTTIQVSFTQNTASIANKVILMVGDSISNRGWIQERLLTYEPTLQFVGTKDSGVGQGVTGYKCEATPGKTAKQMIASGSAINENYAAYVTNLDAVPDIVTIEFGLNETSAADYFTYVQLLIDSIKAYDELNSHTTKIYVLMPFERCFDCNMGHGYNLQYTQIVAGRQIILDSYSFTNCTLIPTSYIFDDRYDYTHTDTTDEYGYGVTMDTVSDFVHPSETVGFKKLTDMIYNYLGA